MADNVSKNGIFREKSMERVSGPESLNDYIRVTKPSVWIALLALVVLLAGVLVWSIFGTVEVKDSDGTVKKIHPISYVINGAEEKAGQMSYAEFKNLSPEEQKKAFAGMTGDEIYALVESSDENWPVTSYDLISPANAKETIVLFDNNGDLHFNLAWPSYGGFVPESIASIGELSGELDVSRDGGDSGHSLSYGRNPDGSYPNDSQRSVPKSSAEVKTGVLDVDKYKLVVDIVSGNGTKEEKTAQLGSLGYSGEIAARFIEDHGAFPSRDEVSGPDNIADGAAKAGHKVDGKYGYYGKTAPWNAGDLKLEGGGGQLCTVFSWGTMRDSGLIRDTGTAKIN
ncbi:MAG: hypothetical protein IJV00_08760 [Clostridia bacterium]|nr:hypothetical protein [Clostridia bacterium]